MNRFLTRGRIVWLIILAVLVIDQIIKIWVKTHMYWHESIRVTDWCYIFFTENVGMAFGMEIFGKLFLTLFRLVAVTFIGWFLYKCVRLKSLKMGFIVCVALILTGALGNIVDSVFYGVLFSQSTPVQLATFLLDALCGRRALHLLQSHLQLCRRGHQLRGHRLVSVLRQVLQ